MPHPLSKRYQKCSNEYDYYYGRYINKCQCYDWKQANSCRCGIPTNTFYCITNEGGCSTSTMDALGDGYTLFSDTNRYESVTRARLAHLHNNSKSARAGMQEARF